MLDVVVSNQALNLSKRDADVAVRAPIVRPKRLIGRRAASIAWAVFAASDTAPDVRSGDGYAFRRLDQVRRQPRQTSKAAKWLKDHADQRRLHINTVLGLAEAAAARIRFAILPCFIGAATPGLKRLGNPLPDLANGIWLLTHADLRQTARVRVFMDFAASEIAKQRKTIEGVI